MGLTVLKLPSCLTQSAPGFFPEGLLQPVVQMLMCSCMARNLLPFPSISSCSSESSLKPPWGLTGSTSTATSFPSRTAAPPQSPLGYHWCRCARPCSQQQLQECSLWCVIHRCPLHAQVGDFQKVQVARGLPQLSNLQLIHSHFCSELQTLHNAD